MSHPDQCPCGSMQLIYRIDGSTVLRRCQDCSRVQIAETDLTPAELYDLTGYLGSCPLLVYRDVSSRVEHARWFRRNEVYGNVG